MPLAHKTCRICLKGHENIFSIYHYKEDIHLPSVICNISGVKIKENLEPNAQICIRCAKAVVSAENIILRCQASNEYLQDELRQNEEKVVNSVETITQASDNGGIKDEDLSNHSTDESEQIETNISKQNDNSTVKSEIHFEEHLEITPLIICGNQKIKSRCSRKRISTKPPPFKCDYCDFYTKTGKLLIAHQREEHQIDDPNIFKCTLCPQRFSWKPTLHRHLENEHNTMPEDKKFLCNECGKGYTSEASLLEHTKQQHGPRRFKCTDPNCEKTFTRAFTLRRHFMRAHANKTPYHCADCDKYFKIYDLWKYHNEVVHKNETVYCPRCGYPFRYKQKLEEHLEREVCKRSVIPCPYCQRRFTAKYGLKKHLQKKHPLI